MSVAASGGATAQLPLPSMDVMAAVLAARPAATQAAEQAAHVVSRNAVVDGHVDTYA